MSTAGIHDHKTLGVLASLASFAMWGLLVIYWKALQHVSAYEILAHRIVWSLVFTAVLLTLCRGWATVLRVLASPRDLCLLAVSSLLVASNWLMYIYAVTHDQILDASLGYYITPLFNVALGIVFLRERPRPAQIAAFVLAGAALTNMLVAQGRLPWIALALAITFGFYALIRKVATLDSLPGLVAETAVLTIPAGVFLAYLAQSGLGATGHADVQTHLLLAGAGIVTATPLLLFTYGARRVSMAAMGIMQYFSPTCALLLAVLLYKEPFDRTRIITFTLIWLALAAYSIHAFIAARRERTAMATAAREQSTPPPQ